MNCVLFAKMDQVFSKENKTLKKILENWKKYWKSQGILSVRKSGNPELKSFSSLLTSSDLKFRTLMILIRFICPAKHLNSKKIIVFNSQHWHDVTTLIKF